jgi:predicted transcriptional regulator
MVTTANSFRLTAAEMFQAQQEQQLRSAGVLIKSYRDFTSSGNPSATQTDIATKAKTKQSVVSDLERGKKVPNDAILQGILTAVGLDTKKPAGKAVFENLRTIRDTQDDIKKLPKHKP